ncbi:MAG: FAD-binding protein [Nanoarchaeota archaeon]|nr:FAD-binding protein [Nanoarchaeota archaeon]
MKKVVIVGAGPAGLFAAYELSKHDDLKVFVIDKGKSVLSRKRSDVMCGVGGAGLFSDGKLNFTPSLSLATLYDFLSHEQVDELLVNVEKIFLKMGMNNDVYPKDNNKVDLLKKKCNEHGVELKVKKIRHIGSDILPRLISDFEKKLVGNGVNFLLEESVEEVLVKNKKVLGVRTDKRVIDADFVIVCAGRFGFNFFSKLIKNFGLDKSYQPIWVGVRVEFPSSILKSVSDILWEPFFYVTTSKTDDVVRTYCTCPYGYVSIEDYENFVCVNGHSTSDVPSENSNFALVYKVALTEPVENTISYGKSIAMLTTNIGGGKPIIQRLGDLRKGRRSTWSRISKSYVIPTLRQVTPGDISMALPSRAVSNLLEALDKLDKVIPGVASDSTLLYAPEVKLTSAKIKTDKFLETSVGCLFVAGDGAGVSGNIVGAACTGIIAARGIVNKNL